MNQYIPALLMAILAAKCFTSGYQESSLLLLVAAVILGILGALIYEP